MESINFQFVEDPSNVGSDALSYDSDNSDFSLVDKKVVSPSRNIKQHVRNDLEKTKEYLEKLREEFDKTYENELSRKMVLELLKPREIIDLEINEVLESLSAIAENKELNDLLKETVRIAKEKIICAKNVAIVGETTIKRTIELLTEILPVFVTACGKSCEAITQDVTVQEEYEKYKDIKEKMSQCEPDLEEMEAFGKQAEEHIAQCIEKAYSDVERISSKRSIEEIEGRIDSFEEKKEKMNTIVQLELDSTKKWLDSCETDLKLLSTWLSEIEKSHTEATEGNEKTKKTLNYKIKANLKEQEELRKQLKAKKKEEDNLRQVLEKEEIYQLEAQRCYNDYCKAVVMQERDIAGIQNRAKTAGEVMTIMEECSRIIMERSIKTEREYCDKLRQLEVAAKESYHQALLTAAVDVKVKINNIDEYINLCNAEKDSWQAKNKSFARKGMNLFAQEAKEKVQQFTEELQLKATEKIDNDEKLSGLTKAVDSITKDLADMSIHVDTLQFRYEQHLRNHEQLLSIA